LATVQINTPTGYAIVNATASGDFVIVNLPASWTIGGASGTVGGSALGGSPVSAGSGSTVYQLAGYAEVVAMAYGDFPTVSISTANGSATGSSSVSAQIATVSIVSVTGSATGSALASGQSKTITVQSQAGSAFGTAVANAAFTTITVVSPNGSAKAFNPPSWARARVWKISPEEYRLIAIPRLKRLTIATSYVKKVNNPRAVEFARPIN